MPDSNAANTPDELSRAVTQEIPDLYELETLEQLRAIADELRTRIVEALTHRAMTVTQLGDLLGQAPAKIHYHVRELERVGLLRLVATHPKSGILEKYYRAVAKTFTGTKTLLRTVPSDETLATMRAFLDNISQGFLRATEFTARHQLWENPKVWGLNATQIWVTHDEMKELAQRVQAEFDRYATPRGGVGEEERAIVMMGYDPRIAEEDKAEAPTSAPGDPAPLAASHAPRQAPPRARHMVVAGTVTLKRADLEEAIAENRQIDLSAIGVCTFANDITANLVERAISHFRHRGVLTASPEVRAALKRKE